MKTLFLPFLFLLMGISCMTPKSDLPIYSREVATVEDFVIKEDVLRFRLRLEADNYPDDFIKLSQKQKVSENLELKKLLDQVLGKMIADYTIVAYGKKHGVEISSEELLQAVEEKKNKFNPKTFENILYERNIPYVRWKQMAEDDIRVQYVLDKMLLKDIKVTESEVNGYYYQHKSEFEVPERARVRHIVTDSYEKAQEVYERLLKGENFAKLAINLSQSPDRAKGGDLGYFSKGVYPKEFDEYCFNLKRGELSPIVKTEYGFHIFKLMDKKSAGLKTVLEVAPQIYQKLFEEKLKAKYDPWFESIKKEVMVTIKKELLEDFVL